MKKVLFCIGLICFLCGCDSNSQEQQYDPMAEQKYIRENCSAVCMGYVKSIMNSYVLPAEEVSQYSTTNSHMLKCGYYESLKQFLYNVSYNCPNLSDCLTKSQAERFDRVFYDCE